LKVKIEFRSSFRTPRSVDPESSDFGLRFIQRHWIPAFAGMTISEDD